MTQLNQHFIGVTAGSVDGNPPNCCIAASPSVLVQSTIWRLRLLNKQGGLIVPEADTKIFYGAGSDAIDPRLVYNELTGQFCSIGRTEGPTALNFAFSKTSKPATLTGADWTFASWPMGVDLPSLGYSADGYYLTFGSLGNVLSRVVNAPDQSSGPLINQASFTLGVLPDELATGGSASVARQPDGIPGDYVWLARVVSDGGNGPDTLRLYRCAPSFFANGYIDCTTFSIPIQQRKPVPDCRQPSPGLSFLGGIGNGDLMLRNVNGRQLLYWCSPIGGPSSNAAILWAIVDVTGTPVLAQLGTVDFGASVDAWCGSVAVNKAGDMALSYNVSGPSTYVAHCAGVKPLINQGGFDSVTVLKSTTPLRCGQNPARAGDYSTACVDPADGSFWVCNEIAQDSTASSNYNWACSCANVSGGSPSVPVTFVGTLTINGTPHSVNMTGVMTP